MNKIAAIVVTYNRKILLKDCINKLKNQTIDSDIIIIDNGSTDGTENFIAELKENIQYFNTGSNLGGAGGFNFGINKAIELGYEYLWLLDDDTMPTETALEMLVEKDKELKGEYGFLTSKVLWKDESICAMNIQKISKWRYLKNFKKDTRVQYASFVSLFIKSSTVIERGLPYKEFFIWSDDWEYTRRISKKEKCYFVSQSIVYHWCDRNVGANIITADPTRIERFKYMYRNDVVMYKQDGIEGLFYLFIRNIIHKVRIYRDGKNKKEKLILIKNTTYEGKNFHPKIEFPKININQR